MNFNFQILQFVAHVPESGPEDPAQGYELKFAGDYRKIIVQVQIEHQEGDPVVRRHHQDGVHLVRPGNKDQYDWKRNENSD